MNRPVQAPLSDASKAFAELTCSVPELRTPSDLSAEQLSSLSRNAQTLRILAQDELARRALAGSHDALEILRREFGQRAIYAGTFDPFTRGHRDLVVRAAKLFDEVVVAIGRNPSKTPLFSEAERIQLIQDDLAELGARVRVTAFGGSLVALARTENCRMVLRGVREVTDFAAENLQALVNQNLSLGNLETLLMPARAEYGFVSSSMVKSVAIAGEEFGDFLTPGIERAFRDRMAEVALQRRWSSLVKNFSGDPEESRAVFLKIVESYQAPDRIHHRLDHLEEMFRILERAGLESSPGLAFAIFFHDIKLEPRAKDNERQSSLVAAELLSRIGAPPALCTEVQRLILLSEGHRVTADDVQGSFFVDADLAVLAGSEKRYARYQKAIRDEYAWVPDADYRKGRAAVLQNFLERPTLFHNARVLDLNQVQAHCNMKQELSAL